jgi:uncharacterized protein (TIGR03067 family)
MKRVWMTILLTFSIVLCALGARADDADKKAVTDDLKKLEGTWVLKENSTNGKRTPDADLKAAPWAEIAIKGDTLKMGKVAFKIVIDPSKTPKTIDRLIKRPDGKDITTEGLYELDGDTLRICLEHLTPDPATGKLTKPGRPKELKPGDRFIMSVYVRKKE